jgi:hypothetical protein
MGTFYTACKLENPADRGAGIAVPQVGPPLASNLL